MKLSNKVLAFLVILAMSISLISALGLMNKIQEFLSKPIELTGKAPTDTGEVNLTVQLSISISLNVDTLDFGSGFINTTKCTNATLSIRHDNGANTYNDSGGNDCWRSTTGADVPGPTNPFEVENDGDGNITLTITGPHPTDFFTGTNPPTASTDLYNLSWQGENMDNGCTSGLVTSWTAFNGTTQMVCDNNLFGFIPTSDELAINIKVQIPANGIDTGREYHNDSIVFTALII